MTTPGQPEPASDYPLRLGSFLISYAAHAVLAAALMLISTPSSRVSRPVYDEAIKPYANKIIFYDFRRKQPEVNPQKRVGRARQPQGAELSAQTIIATSPKPKSSQVFISVPAPKVEITEEMPTPILVSEIQKLHAATPAPKSRPESRQFPPLSTRRFSPCRPIRQPRPPTTSRSPGSVLRRGRSLLPHARRPRPRPRWSTHPHQPCRRPQQVRRRRDRSTFQKSRRSRPAPGTVRAIRKQPWPWRAFIPWKKRLFRCPMETGRRSFQKRRYKARWQAGKARKVAL